MDSKIKQTKTIPIGQNIRNLRQAKGIGQTELVRLLQLRGIDITRESLVKIERGIQHIYASQLKGIRDVLKTTYDELLTLSETIGYPPEAALSYAVRLVNACIREGLLTDVPARAWPQEAHMDRGKVIEFPGAKKTE